MIKQQNSARPVPPAALDNEPGLDFTEATAAVRHREPPDSDAHFDATRMYFPMPAMRPRLTRKRPGKHSRLKNVTTNMVNHREGYLVSPMHCLPCNVQLNCKSALQGRGLTGRMRRPYSTRFTKS